MAENVDKYLKMGYRKFQLKVGGNVCDDIARIRAVRELLDRKTLELRESSKAKIRTEGVNFKVGEYDESNVYLPLLCDANTGWLQHQAVQVMIYWLIYWFIIVIVFINFYISVILLFNYLVINLYVYLYNELFIYFDIVICFNLFIYWSIYSFIYSFNESSFINLFVYLFINLSAHFLINYLFIYRLLYTSCFS